MKQTLSASKIKTMTSCSWLYWCKYHLKLPDKTNDGALKGSIVHLVLECLGKSRHKKHYVSILNSGDILSCEPVKKLIYKHALKCGLWENPENLVDICDMTFNGLVYDFFGKTFGEPTETISEKDFELEIAEGEISYKVKGFIDKLFLYEDKGVAIVRDFKTNKKVFEGKDVTDNLQDNIYTLAVRKLYPDLDRVKMEFIFLKKMSSEFDVDEGMWKAYGHGNSILLMEEKDEFELEGFEYQLTDYQNYADGFDENVAQSDFAYHKGMPNDGSFSGRLLCGFAKEPNELKKDGNPKWYCAYKFPFEYYAVSDKDGKLKKSYFTEEEAISAQKDGDTIEKMQYNGCPCFSRNNSYIMPENDPFDLDKF